MIPRPFDIFIILEDGVFVLPEMIMHFLTAAKPEQIKQKGE